MFRVMRPVGSTGVGGVGVGFGFGGVGVGVEPLVKLTCITSTHDFNLQSPLLLKYPYPLSPQLVPHEFLINQCVALYPTNNTAWLGEEAKLLAQAYVPLFPKNINPLSDA